MRDICTSNIFKSGTKGRVTFLNLRLHFTYTRRMKLRFNELVFVYPSAENDTFLPPKTTGIDFDVLKKLKVISNYPATIIGMLNVM